MAYAIQLYREDEGKTNNEQRSLCILCCQAEEKMGAEKKPTRKTMGGLPAKKKKTLLSTASSLQQ
ncbi:hypothetical protein PAXRUDRAFT_13752 [Paxillus rubicundulus Ve08.2h10]|uniref:Uncharacterized protein n=1 Tax=Paxillus rubicundulus Ve08.2h10 TaxID=930991 RepID=A0A0D0E3D8_9AGAM|nr:hypothetical protein PAXRUDRAFT_13752 [Paxillus rubicundulus Ve08.2h10]